MSWALTPLIVANIVWPIEQLIMLRRGGYDSEEGLVEVCSNPRNYAS